MRWSLKFLKFWDKLRTGFWFLPLIMSLSAITLHFILIWVDRRYNHDILVKLQFIWVGGLDGAREVLSTIATTTISLTGVTFSITIVALSLASSQFGPHILRNFLRDRGNQFVLGTFVSTFIYALFVLRTLSEINGEAFVPWVSITFSIFLSMASLATLVYFIHHISVSIQAPNVVHEAFRELQAGIKQLFPDKDLKPLRQFSDSNNWTEAFTVYSEKSGYLQSIGSNTLAHLAKQEGCVLRTALRPGAYVLNKDPLLQVLPGVKLSDRLAEKLRNQFILGPSRTPLEDIECSISQIVEIAVRALSPGINDPFTAIHCLDCLTAALSEMLERRFPECFQLDEEQNIRFLFPPIMFEEILHLAFSPIRQYTTSSQMVMRRLAECLKKLKGRAIQDVHRHDIQTEIEFLLESIRQSTLPETDRRRCLEILE